MKINKNLLILVLAGSLAAACDRVPNSANLAITSASAGSGSQQQRGAEDSLKKDHKEQTQIAEKISEKLENLGVREDQLGLKQGDAGSVKGTETVTPNQEQQLTSDIEKKMDAKLEQLDASGQPIPAESSPSAAPVKGTALDSAPQKESKTNQEIEQKMDAKEEPLKSSQPQPTPSSAP